MLNSNPAVVSLGNAELLAATRAILRRACVVEADLLVHLAEIEERRLHSEMAFPTMFAFCVDELGFSGPGLQPHDRCSRRETIPSDARLVALWSRAAYRVAPPRPVSHAAEPPRLARGGGGEV